MRECALPFSDRARTRSAVLAHLQGRIAEPLQRNIRLRSRMGEQGLPEVNYADVAAAAAAISGVATRTPVLTSRYVDEAVGASVFFKCENFQRVGAFKFRGAYNALSRFGEEQRRGGVIAFSSGNHAQAVALAARLLDMPATIVMPIDAPSAKLAATRGYGAEVITYERTTEDREAIAARLLAERGGTLDSSLRSPPCDRRTGNGSQRADRGSRRPGLSVRLRRRRRPDQRMCPGRGASCPRAARSSALSRRPGTMPSSRFALAASCALLCL